MSDLELEKKGALVTTREIEQQPILWEETLMIYQKKQSEIEEFIKKIVTKHGRVKVLFAGAGTSAYVGDTIFPYLQERAEIEKFEFQKAPTTSIVSNPYQYYRKDCPTILVSFARSGNSPESVAAVNLGKQLVDNFYQITITCASDGALAQAAKNDQDNFLLLMPEKSNDRGFAMTGSFTCMTLTALLIFDPQVEKINILKTVISMGEFVLEKEEALVDFIEDDFARVIYLGSGVFEGLAREVQLKILELSAGKKATGFDSSVGFRHGPKSLVNEQTILFEFVSNDGYTRKYDKDMLDELTEDNIAKKVIAIQVAGENEYDGKSFSFPKEYHEVPDAYLTLPFAMVGQIIALQTALKIGNRPDTPSPNGTVNRVVQGVEIHSF